MTDRHWRLMIAVEDAMLKRFVVGAGLVGLLGWAYMKLPNTIYYRNGRPTELGRRVNNFQAWLYGLGLRPAFLVQLEWRGRKSGRTFHAPVVVADYEGERYLVSMLGPRSWWVRNIMSAGGQAWMRHGARHKVRLVEVPPGERAPIIRAYLRRAPGARPHIPVALDAPLAEFEALAGSYPVFRIEEHRAQPGDDAGAA